jgi:diacylglycerol kinase family enzyme
MVRVFALLRTVRLEIEVNGKLQYYRTPLVFVGLGEREFQVPSLGKRVKGGERALHVFVVRGRERARLFRVALAAVVRGAETVARMPDVDAFLVQHSTIDMRGGRAVVAFDGETEVMRLPLDYRIERDALRVVVPEAVAAEPVEASAPTAVAV